MRITKNEHVKFIWFLVIVTIILEIIFYGILKIVLPSPNIDPKNEVIEIISDYLIDYVKAN